MTLSPTWVKERRAMDEGRGVAIAILSCCFGAGAAVATRYLVDSADPVTLGAIRFGGGVLCLVPLALLAGIRWPRRRDWPGVAALGFLFYGVFFVLYNVALDFTTVARGTLALSTLPLMTLVVGAVLRVESRSRRKTLGVLVAMAGVAVALGSSLAAAPPGAWRGDLIMAAATFCMALYNVYSRRFVQRSSALGFLAGGMAVGGSALVLVSLGSGGFRAVLGFGTGEWIAAAYLAAGGGALAFFLWVVALQHASPTRVANTMTVNPLVAALLAAVILAEPIAPSLVVGLAAVFAGIAIATSVPRPVALSPPSR
jgi:drug/metabolite transporter (DMT)-like permease